MSEESESDLGTELAISGIGIPFFAARGLTQTLTVIDSSVDLRRTINGSLEDFSYDQFRKYSTKITCNDMRTLAFDGVYPGLQIVVDCINEFCFTTLGGSPSRTVVPGSERTEGDFTFYRPRLTMRVRRFEMDQDEAGAKTGWSLEAEEK